MLSRMTAVTESTCACVARNFSIDLSTTGAAATVADAAPPTRAAWAEEAPTLAVLTAEAAPTLAVLTAEEAADDNEEDEERVGTAEDAGAGDTARAGAEAFVTEDDEDDAVTFWVVVLAGGEELEDLGGGDEGGGGLGFVGAVADDVVFGFVVAFGEPPAVAADLPEFIAMATSSPLLTACLLSFTKVIPFLTVSGFS